MNISEPQQAGVPASERSPIVEKEYGPREIQHEIRMRALAFFTASLMAVPALARPAAAEVIWSTSAETGQAEITQRDEVTGSRTHVRLVPYFTEVGTHSSPVRIFNPLFDKMRTLESAMPGVNATIQDPIAWRAFVWSEAQSLGLDTKKKGTLTLAQALELSIKIATRNMTYLREIDPTAGKINEALDAQVNIIPIDQLVMNKDFRKGVCRHFSVMLADIFDILTSDSQSLYVQNGFMKTIVVPQLPVSHAVNAFVVIEKDAHGDDDIQIEYIDISNGNPWKESDFKTRYFKPYEQQKNGFSLMFNAYVQRALTSKERIESAAYWAAHEKENTEHILIHPLDLALSYLAHLTDLYKAGKDTEAQKLFDDFRALHALHKDQYAKEAARNNYEVLYSAFSSIYTIHAQYQKTAEQKRTIEHEGQGVRLHSLKARHEALLHGRDFQAAFRAGEDYCDLLAQMGDSDGAETFYRSLFEIVQSHPNDFFLYERPMKNNSGQWIHIQPLKDKESLEEFIAYKKRTAWKKK